MHGELGGIEAPGTLVGMRFPSVIVPVCVVSRCVYTSVVKCVLQRAHSVSAAGVLKRAPCVRDPVCEWYGGECAKIRASQHAVCEWNHVCEGNGTRE